MPYVNIKMTKENAIPQKNVSLRHNTITQLLVDVLWKNPNTTVEVIDEVDTDNYFLLFFN
jgi:phenylpyruvate tautomerase PptA (4-oxalocrotonate tautomerase family)